MRTIAMSALMGAMTLFGCATTDDVGAASAALGGVSPVPGYYQGVTAIDIEAPADACVNQDLSFLDSEIADVTAEGYTVTYMFAGFPVSAPTYCALSGSSGDCGDLPDSIVIDFGIFGLDAVHTLDILDPFDHHVWTSDTVYRSRGGIRATCEGEACGLFFPTAPGESGCVTIGTAISSFVP